MQVFQDNEKEIAKCKYNGKKQLTIPFKTNRSRRKVLNNITDIKDKGASADIVNNFMF